ncbi:hypothetical protein U1Q18_035118 [Sarracenia purpurea var. burkii]
MADNNEGDQIAGGSFSHLFFPYDVVGLDSDGCYDYASSLSNQNPPKMLRFDDYPKSGLTCSDSSSTSSSSTTNPFSKPNKKRNGTGSNESIQILNAGTGTPGGSDRVNSKKAKQENSTFTGNGKVRREKLGERITALQQLVSPYGKTDTASVLHEAMGYIRFLQEQVQVLCSPYLQRLPSSLYLPEEGEEDGEAKPRKDLRSRGLCLVPVEWTVHVANNNGADFWSPAAVEKHLSPSTKKLPNG